MLTVLTYIQHFFTVVLLGCLSPANWKQCVQVHTWVPPYVQDLKDFKTNPPYSLEKNGVQLREEYERNQRNLHAGPNGSQSLPSLLQK